MGGTLIRLIDQGHEVGVLGVLSALGMLCVLCMLWSGSRVAARLSLLVVRPGARHGLCAAGGRL